ncbi:MAG: MFS transporter [Candidatus Omnitrophota bacterium]
MIIGSLTREKLIVLIFLCLGCFITSFNVADIAASVPVISQDLHISKFQVAKIIPFYLLPYGIGALFYAPLTRFISFRWVYIVTLLLYGVSCLICGLASNLEIMLAGRVMMGLSAAGSIPLGLMIIGESFERKIRGRLVGIFFSHAFIASIIGLITGGIFSWRIIFFIPAVLSFLLALGNLIYKSDCLQKKHVGNINYLKTLEDKRILIIFLFIFALSFIYHGVHKWYGVYLSDIYKFDQLTINFFVILTVLSGMAGQLIGGVLSDRKGRRYTTKLGVAGLSLSIMMLFGVYPKSVLGAVLMSIALFWTIGHNGISTFITDFADEDRPAIASLNSSVRFISGGLGFMISKYFVEYSFRWTFLVFGLILSLLYFATSFTLPAAKATTRTNNI